MDRYNEALELRERLRRELDRVEKFLALWNELFPDGAPQPASTIPTPAAPQSAETAKPAPAPRASIVSQDAFAQITAEVLRRHGHPAPRPELIDLLRAAGYEIGGKDVKKNMGTKLWRARETIIHLPKHGYWVKDLPYGPARYDPKAAQTAGVGVGVATSGVGPKPEVKAKNGADPEGIFA